MPDKLIPPVPETMTLGGVDQTVVVLAFAALSDETAIADWTRELATDRRVVSGTVTHAISGDRVVAMLRTHPRCLQSISDRRPECVTDLVAVDRAPFLELLRA